MQWVHQWHGLEISKYDFKHAHVIASFLWTAFHPIANNSRGGASTSRSDYSTTGARLESEQSKSVGAAHIRQVVPAPNIIHSMLYACITKPFNHKNQNDPNCENQIKILTTETLRLKLPQGGGKWSLSKYRACSHRLWSQAHTRHKELRIHGKCR